MRWLIKLKTVIVQIWYLAKGMIFQAVKMGVMNRSCKTFSLPLLHLRHHRTFPRVFLLSVIPIQNVRSLVQPHERELEHPQLQHRMSNVRNLLCLLTGPSLPLLRKSSGLALIFLECFGISLCTSRGILWSCPRKFKAGTTPFLLRTPSAFLSRKILGLAANCKCRKANSQVQ